MDNPVHFGRKIKGLIEKRDGNVGVAAERLKYSVQALYRTFEKEDVSTSLLKKLANAYGVGLGYFTNDSNDGSSTGQHGEQTSASKLDIAERKIEILETEKKGLDEQVKLLREMVDVLKSRDK